MKPKKKASQIVHETRAIDGIRTDFMGRTVMTTETVVKNAEGVIRRIVRDYIDGKLMFESDLDG